MRITVSANLTIETRSLSDIALQAFLEKNAQHLLVAAMMSVISETNVGTTDDLFGVETLALEVNGKRFVVDESGYLVAE